jgi:hypothetical protein
MNRDGGTGAGHEQHGSRGSEGGLAENCVGD